MDDKDFRKHLRDLVHGHHHPEEHDWGPEPKTRTSSGRSTTKRKTAKTAARKTTKRRAK